ncbi:unnamed protein product [Prorocentrum cordatum]|uniref:Protein kinase domain-containing protein n=1 Tax=Prorocentrum cordatum TaxID=2364126 RepID=A0ABN9Y2W5_9DINO|nr:unnamed protein product [Polarella glacialis]
MYQIFRGMLCLRTSLVVHRDMKPGNVLVKANGDVKIADLGLARTIDADDDDHDEAVLTEYVVTRYYRAPEVVLTATHYTYAVDMWSTGCILGEMLTTKPVFAGKDSLDQIKKIVGVIGSQSVDEMNWIPKSSPSWKFVEKCNKVSTGEAFQKLLQTPGLDPNAVDLLVQTLRFNPSKRIPIEDALGHPYLEAFQADSDPEVRSAKEVVPMDWLFDKELCFDDRAGRSPTTRNSSGRRCWTAAGRPAAAAGARRRRGAARAPPGAARGGAGRGARRRGGGRPALRARASGNRGTPPARRAPTPHGLTSARRRAWQAAAACSCGRRAAPRAPRRGARARDRAVGSVIGARKGF